MEYKTFKKMGISPSMLGYGCMRLPLLKDGKIDEPEAERLLDTAIAAGVTYIDTAYPYHDGDSEPFVGRVLKKYDRSSFYLATKLPIWKLESAEDAKQIFEEQLARLDVDYVDFYLLHALDQAKWELILKLGILDVVDELKAQGKIRHLGFSFHDQYSVFETILSYRDWDFCQIQLNYMDTDVQAGLKGYRLAEQLNIPMIIMEPIKGGTLAKLPSDLEEIFRASLPSASISSWALRWVGSHSNVKVILSGMSTYDQVIDNLKTFDQFKPLSTDELAVVDHVASTIKSRQKNGCTACQYCMPCPFGVNIPRNFQYWNEGSMYQNESRLKRYFTMGNEKAEFCQECGLCETMCPQGIQIRHDLKQLVSEINAL